MTGHVFHPGHDEWHGQTVVVYTRGARTVVGRWDSLVGDQALLRDVAVHEAGAGGASAEGETREAWVARLQQYGIPVSRREFTLPQGEIERVTRLRDA